MPVVGVLRPAAQNAFTTVGFPDVQLATVRVGDEVDALDGAERGAPGRVARILDDVAELSMVDQDTVKTGERYDIGVGDLDYREG